MSFELSLESLEVEESREISMESLEIELEKNRKQMRELNRISKDLSDRGVINRGVAASIESLADTVPSLESHFKSYPVQSYTEAFTRTNLKVTQEGLVGGIVSAVVNALKKIAGWISSAFKWLWNMITGKKAAVEKSVVVAEKTEEVIEAAVKVDLVKIFEDVAVEMTNKFAEDQRRLEEEERKARQEADRKAASDRAEAARKEAEAKRANEELQAKIKKHNEQQSWLEEQLNELKADDEIGNFLNDIGKDITVLQETMFFQDQPVDVDGYKYHYSSIMVGLLNTMLKSQSTIYDNANKFAQITSMAPAALDENIKKWDVEIDQFIRQYTPKKEPVLVNGETKFSLTIENIDKLTSKANATKVTKRFTSTRELQRSIFDCRKETVKYLRDLKAISKDDLANEMNKVSSYVSKVATSLPNTDLTKEHSASISTAATLLHKTINSVHRSIKVLEIFSDERLRYIKKVSGFAKTYVEKVSELERKGLLPEKYKSDLSAIIKMSKLNPARR